MIIEVCLLLRIIQNEEHFVEKIAVSSCEATKEPTSPKSVLETLATSKTDFLNIESDTPSSRLSPSLWVYRPETQTQVLSDDLAVKHMMMKPTHSLTRLAKSLSLGFDPYFSKGYFEPFEKRQKPVTLVAFRKNGFIQKSKSKMPNLKSAETAELQSPFNDVSNFWVDE